jgi:hypothetical protein
MNFHFSRNIHFSRHLKTDDRVREFNFRKLPSPDNNLFHVDVPDDRGNRIVFKMQKQQDSQWKIVDQPLPKWVWDNEKGLNDLIEEELQHV